jgi:histidine triad (HIT) family protein
MACVFCQIVAGRAPSKKVYEDEDVLAFHDVRPQAPVHALVVPKKHIASLVDLTPEDDALLGRLVRCGREVAGAAGLDKRGFRLVFNCGADAGYSVFHIHLHVVGGRPLGWPPG